MAAVIGMESKREQPEASQGIEVQKLPAIMSPAQLGEELDVSVRTLERWRDAGAGPEYQHPAGTRFYRYYGADVAAWLENRKPGAVTPGQNINA